MKSIKIILDNLKQFKEDKINVFECIKIYSSNNSDYITNDFINELLDLDKVI